MAEFALSPAELNFPLKFQTWRPNQSDAICRVIDSERRFIGLSLPTGDGKSGVYVAAASVMSARTVILTSTKQLQTQLLEDFAGLGLTDIRGRANYPCRIAPDVNCETGKYAHCSATRELPLFGDPLCPYKLAYKRALEADLIVTNYSYWALINKYGEGLGPVDMLVLDEAHNAPDEVCGVMTVTIHPADVLRRLRTDWPSDPDNTDSWRRWAAGLKPRAQTLLDECALEIRTEGASNRLTREMGHLQNLVRSLGVIAEIRGEWIAESSASGTYTLAPVWPSDHAEDTIFLGIPKVVLASATILPKTGQVLGIPDTEMEFYEYPSSFPARRSPVYYIPTVKVNHHWSDSDVETWISRIDEIISRRLDRRGVIHSVSYDRRDLILARSRYARHMLTHSPGSEAAMEQLRRFRNTPPPVILLSPSITTGVDLPFEACEYQIICKVPFPDTRSKIVQARVGRLAPRGSPERAAGREFEIYSTVQTLVQETGRGMRAATDQCENFVIDSQIDWIERWHKKLIPLWWRRLFRRCRSGVPKPPPPLADSRRQPLPGDV